MAEFFKIDDRLASNRALQKRLRAISRNDERIPSVFIDGIYGKETEAAVRAFQETRGLPVNGVADFETHRRINEEYGALLTSEERFVGAPDFDRYEGGVISLGDEFDGVIALQLLFRSIGEQDDRFLVPRDGVYGEETANAVRFFKTLRGSLADEKVDRVFWNELALFSERFTEDRA